MKSLDKNSLTYKRRLVRKLNENSFDGFYAPIAAHVVRCNRARLRKGVLECHCFAVSPEWFVPSKESFSDPHGREICV